MPSSPSIESLELRRADIANQISALGDLRSGSITTTFGRCGKPNCHGHQSENAGHGPNLRLTDQADGKTVTVSLPDPIAVRKAEREIAEFRQLQNLHKQFVEVNARTPESVSPGPAAFGCWQLTKTLRVAAWQVKFDCCRRHESSSGSSKGSTVEFVSSTSRTPWTLFSTRCNSVVNLSGRSSSSASTTTLR